MSSTISRTTVPVAPTPTLGKYNINIKGSYDAEIKERVSQLFQNNLPLILALAVLTIPVFFAAWPIGYMLVRQDKQLELNSQIAERKLMFLRELGYMLPQDLTDTGSSDAALSEMAKNPDARLLFQEHEVQNSISDNAKSQIIEKAYKIKNNTAAEKEVLIALRLKTLEETEQNSKNKNSEKNEIAKIVKEANRPENLTNLTELIESEIIGTIKKGTQLYSTNDTEVLLRDLSRTIYSIKTESGELVSKSEANRIRESISKLSWENQKLSVENGSIKHVNGKLKNEEELSEDEKYILEENEKKIGENKKTINSELNKYTSEALKYMNTIDQKKTLEFENKKLLHRIIMSSLVQTIPNCTIAAFAGSLISLQGKDIKYIFEPGECPEVRFHYEKTNNTLKITYGGAGGINLKAKNCTGKIIHNLNIKVGFELTISLQKNGAISSSTPIAIPENISAEELADPDVAKRRAAAKEKPMFLSCKVRGFSVESSY
jgi:hypothetical protein